MGQQILLGFLLVTAANHHFTISPHSSITAPEMCDSHDKAAQYHILGS
jgi:hypothetical protein